MMQTDVNKDVSNDANNNEIAELEEVLNNFQEEWQETQAIRSKKWRKTLLNLFCVNHYSNNDLASSLVD